MAEVLDKLQLFRITGPETGVLTDREINLLGAAYALVQLGGPGEFELPASKTVVSWSEGGNGKPVVSVSGTVSVEDLPAGTAEFIERMDPTKQPERERWLFENCPENQQRREEAARRVKAGREADERRRRQHEEEYKEARQKRGRSAG